MIQWGLISKMDSEVLMKTIDLACNEFPIVAINFLEVGIYSGQTGNAAKKYIESKDRVPYITGIDNNKDNEPLRFQYDKLIIGNSNEVYNQIPDNSQHLILEDSCHCFSCVCSTFFCYAPKVKVGGYFAFHDTGRHIKPFKDFQHGDKNNPDAYISVRKALASIGMFEDAGYDAEAMAKGIRYKGGHGFRLIFDEADIDNEAGGICCFRKLY